MTRKTISIDSDVEAALREIQSKFIKADSRSWSLSKIVNIVLASAMMNSKDLTINDWGRIRQFAKGSRVDLASTETDGFVENVLFQEIAALK